MTDHIVDADKMPPETRRERRRRRARKALDIILDIADAVAGLIKAGAEYRDTRKDQP